MLDVAGVHVDWAQVALATFAFWLAWETRGLRKATLRLLTATRRESRLSLAPYLFIQVSRDQNKKYKIRVLNESTALALQVDSMIYDSANKHYIQFVQLTHSKPDDEDEPAVVNTIASRDDAVARVTERHTNADLKLVVAVLTANDFSASEYSAAFAFFEDGEGRLYATKRLFEVEAGVIRHIDQQRILCSRHVAPAKWWSRVWDGGGDAYDE